ncbi:unnamed protein product [Heterobilharzia americana]|nr:unnamed protein product [Heterobilharzia americana]CAH8572450.1 unnamed protein product [Heterobilharzia americana]
MSSIAVQTEETLNEDDIDSSLSIGLFTQILSILDDERNSFYYDISENYSTSPFKLKEIHLNEHVMKENHEDLPCHLDNEEVEISEFTENIEEMSTAELERSLQISESRLRNNLNELNKITTSTTEQIKDWLDSAYSQQNNSTLTSPGVQIMDTEGKDNLFNDYETD